MDEQQRTQLIQQAFDTVAQGYDHPSLAFFPKTAERMLQHLNPDEDGRLLDVCTGTGVVALEAARRMPRGKIVGIDLSSGMLEQAQKKSRQQGLDHIEFVHSALQDLSFSRHQFDIITSSFGLFFMDDMQKALEQMLVMLKPGGRVAISSFVDNAFNPMSDIFLNRYESFGMDVPSLSWKRLCSESDIRALFSLVGIDQVDLYHEPLGFYMEQAQDWWDIVWNAGYRGLLNQLSPQDQQLFEQQHREEIARLCESEPPWLDTGVIIAIGHST